MGAELGKGLIHKSCLGSSSGPSRGAAVALAGAAGDHPGHSPGGDAPRVCVCIPAHTYSLVSQPERDICSLHLSAEGHVLLALGHPQGGGRSTCSPQGWTPQALDGFGIYVQSCWVFLWIRPVAQGTTPNTASSPICIYIYFH